MPMRTCYHYALTSIKLPVPSFWLYHSTLVSIFKQFSWVTEWLQDFWRHALSPDVVLKEVNGEGIHYSVIGSYGLSSQYWIKFSTGTTTQDQYLRLLQILSSLLAFSVKPSCLAMMHMVQEIRGQTRHWRNSALRLIGLARQGMWIATARNALSVNNANYLLLSEHLSPASLMDNHGKWLQQMFLRYHFHKTTTAIYLSYKTISPNREMPSQWRTKKQSKSQENLPSSLPCVACWTSYTQTKAIISRVPSWPKHWRHFASVSPELHPQGDGMVERLYCSVLQLLRVYVQKHDDWEQYSFCRWFYMHTSHQSMLLLESTHSCLHVCTVDIQYKLAFLVQQRLTWIILCPPVGQVGRTLRLCWHQLGSCSRASEVYLWHTLHDTWPFRTRDLVWVLIPSVKKLDPQWEEEWRVKSLKAPFSVEITNGRWTRVVHVNRCTIATSPLGLRPQALIATRLR